MRTAGFGLDLAETLYLIGDKLDPSVRGRIGDALRQRLLDPFRRKLTTGKGCWWLGSVNNPKQNNWNAVCLAGVVGGALMLVPDKTERALYVAAGEHYSDYYLNSFTSDGYCEEGVGYWDYGFGQFAVLREEIVQATGGKVDLFSNPRVAAMALFGIRIRIGPDAIPPFGDCRFGSKPDAGLLSYCNDTMALGLDMAPFSGNGARIVDTLMTATPCSTRLHARINADDPLRTLFPKPGVLACRPAPGSACHLGIGIKAGGNGNHSHNDIGSYAIAIGNDEPTGDPGGPHMYNGATFGPHRYDYKILNSFGHPVPVVAGQLQIEAARARPVVLSTAFTGNRDQVTIDMTSAYHVPALKRLTRTMTYSRAGAGQIEIIDNATFSGPSAFEDALITHGDWKQIDARTFELSIGHARLLATVQTPGGFTVKSEKIQELGSPAFTRLGLVLNKPTANMEVRMTFKPKTNMQGRVQ